MKVQTVSDIKLMFAQSDEGSWESLINAYKEDERSSVKKIAEQYSKKLESYHKELERIKSICIYENSLYAKGIPYICGIDEVGRGPLAGPVVACAVILPKGFVYPGINDSKKLSEKKRIELDKIIRANAISYEISEVSHNVIDEINILNASIMAMKNAVEKLRVKPSHLLVDAVKIPDVDIPQTNIIEGDAKSISIAAASIVAKVYRDSLMVELGKEYPMYGFDSNKGYGSQAHIEALKKYGPSPYHRSSFRPRELRCDDL